MLKIINGELVHNIDKVDNNSIKNTISSMVTYEQIKNSIPNQFINTYLKIRILEDWTINFNSLINGNKVYFLTGKIHITEDELPLSHGAALRYCETSPIIDMHHRWILTESKTLYYLSGNNFYKNAKEFYTMSLTQANTGVYNNYLDNPSDMNLIYLKNFQAALLKMNKQTIQSINAV